MLLLVLERDDGILQLTREFTYLLEIDGWQIAEPVALPVARVPKRIPVLVERAEQLACGLEFIQRNQFRAEGDSQALARRIVPLRDELLSGGPQVLEIVRVKWNGPKFR
jgi:hypothetical protein